MAAPMSEECKTKTLAPGSGRFRAILLVAAICLGLFQAARLFWFINRYSVDVPYWDQWDFYKAFFTPHTPWQIFAWQHGPHRQGLGFFLTWMVNELTDWNQRAQCFTIGLVMLSAALASLWLKRRLLGRLQWHDIIPVLFILSLQQWQLYVDTPNVSHGALPLLLVIFSCVAWTVRSVYWRYALVLLLGFLATYTGFGLFVGMVNPLLLTADVWLARRRGSRRELIAAGVALVLAAASLASFYTNYRFKLIPAAAHVTFPDPNWHLYPVFMSIQFAGLFGVRGLAVGTAILGLLIIAGLVAILAIATVRLSRPGSQAPLARVIFFLIAFSLLFSVNASIGRLRLGLVAAGESRYFPLLVPAALAVYFALASRPAGRLRKALTLVLLVCAMLATMRVVEHRRVEATFEGKTRWVAAYLETQRVVDANAKAGFKVYPLHGPPFMSRLEWLREHRYSFFREAALPSSRPSGGLEPVPATAAAAGQ